MTQPVIELDRLTRCYGEITAVDQVSFTVHEGEVFGLLGPNGAGKTTLIRMLTTLLRPTSGTARVAGHDTHRQPEAVRRSIGVLAQAATSDLDLTGRETLDIFGKYYGMPEHVRRERIPQLLELIGLTGRASHLVATYSGGMRRRLEIARALIHLPSILFLDEPTLGLDPQSRRVVWELLQQFTSRFGVTIFLTTHYMEEADRLCDRIAIIDGGRIIVLDTPNALKQTLPQRDVIELVVDQPERGLEALRRVPGVGAVSQEGGCLRVTVDAGARALPPILDGLQQHGLRVTTISLTQPSLEDVFLHYTGRSIREEEPKKVSFFIGAGVPQRGPR